MAKPLTVTFAGETVNFDLQKVERSKLYGYVETVVVDEAGKTCELATLIADGHSVVGKGGTGLGYLSPDGLWRKKADLKAVDVHGHVITPVKSTFDAPVMLEQTASINDYLSHNITSIYQLTPDEVSEPLVAELKNGTIFQFPFSYRGGLEASVGFLLLGSDGNTFMCVGVPTTIEFIGLESVAPLVSETDEAGDEDDDLGFGIM